MNETKNISQISISRYPGLIPRYFSLFQSIELLVQIDYENWGDNNLGVFLDFFLHPSESESYMVVQKTALKINKPTMKFTKATP